MYRVITYPDAQEQVDALPIEALRSYAEVMGVLELAPGNGRPYNSEHPDRPMRELVFGNGQGTVTYLVLESRGEVHVLLAQWIG